MPVEEAHTTIENSDFSEKIQIQLSDHILDFLSSPWLYASSENLQNATCGYSLEFFHRTSDSWRHFTRQAYALWNLTPFWYAFPKNDNSRIMLLANEQTEQLMLMLGLLALTPELKTMISGSQIRELKQDFPGLYPACLRMTGIHPAVLKKLSEIRSEQPSDFSRKTVIALGQNLLTGMLCHLPQELQDRWKLKFSPSPEKNSISEPLPLEESNGLLLFLLHHLHLESWQLCCC